MLPKEKGILVRQFKATNVLFFPRKYFLLISLEKQILNVCVCSVAKSCLILCGPMDCITPGFPVLHTRLPCPSQNLLKFMSIGSAMLSNHLIPCCPLSFCLQFSQHWGLFQ